jgi:hypothetical protein
MKVALLQFAPEVGKVKENIERADEMLQETKLPADLDWLVLPEMAFTGMYQTSNYALCLLFYLPGRSEYMYLNHYSFVCVTGLLWIRLRYGRLAEPKKRQIGVFIFRTLTN